MKITGDYLKNLVREQIKKENFLNEGLTPDQRKELKKKERELHTKYLDLNEEYIDLDSDVDLINDKLESPQSYGLSNSDKASLRKEKKEIEDKREKKKAEVDAAWTEVVAARNKLGKKYDPRRSRDKEEGTLQESVKSRFKVLANINKKLIREELELEGKKEAGEEKYSSLETDYGNVSDKVEKLKRKLQRLTDPSKKKEMQSKIDALEDKMKSLDDEIESLSSQLSKYYK